jgi:hypothetical protein
MSTHDTLSRLLATPLPLARPRPVGRALLLIASGFLIAIVGSWFATRALLPELFPRWGYLLITLLGLWGASSAWLLLPPQLRWLVPALVLGAAVTGALLSSIDFITTGVALLASLALLVLIGAGLGLARLFRRHGPGRLLLAGYGPLLILAPLILANAVATWQPPVPAAGLPVIEELRAFERLDQADRHGWLFVLDASRDDARLARVRALDAQGLLSSPEAQYYGALVMQHGNCPADFQRAYELAHAAVEAGYNEALWLDHATYDRWMLSIGQPQRYNTQAASVDIGGSCAQ